MKQYCPVEIFNVTKRYGNIVAVDGLSFNIAEGTLVGLLGPNGAGKTTLIKVLTTLARPSAGTAKVAGFDVRTQRTQVRAVIGVVPQDNNLDRFLTARENLVLHARMHGMPAAEYNERIDYLLKLMELKSRENEMPDKYSGGMQRRLVVARALVHNPKVLFLDEPTAGLDPQSRRAVWDYVFALKGKITILLTTHYMEEADVLADRIIVMDKGKTIADGTSTELKRMIGQGNRYDLEFKEGGADYLSRFSSLDYVCSVSQTDNTISVDLKGVADLRSLLCAIDASDLLRVTVHEPTLEDVFIQLTGKTLRD